MDQSARAPGRSAAKFRVVLIKPSRYDDDGYLVSHVFGAVPCNTLMVLDTLTRSLMAEKRILGEGVRTRIDIYDEAVHRVPVERIIRQGRRPEVRLLVCLCAVQTAQYPRAFDLAKEFRAAGLSVAIGGFHVSGSLAMLPGIPPEIRSILDLGVTVVKGEVEEQWSELLVAAYEGKLEPLYDFTGDAPDLSKAPVPLVQKSYLRRFPSYGLATIDAGRGCPFKCSFCTVINVQGRKPRFRSPEAIKAAMIDNYQRARTLDYLLTDDNFARNERWQAIFESIIELREVHGMPVTFSMQIDTLAHNIPGFVEKAARAGCRQVFIGMESVNPENLTAVCKRHNEPARFAEIIQSWHDRGMITHAAYIIGFPADRYESVMRDVETLKREIRPDLVSFFQLTPLPGSEDHLRAWREGAVLEPDLNRYDTCQPTMRHPRMSAEEWQRAYQDAWKSFYEFENVKRILSHVHPRAYRNCFTAILWYRQAALLQGAHPLVSGFWRKRDRHTRREGFPRETLVRSWGRRLRRARSDAGGWGRFWGEALRLWWETRGAAPGPGT